MLAAPLLMSLSLRDICTVFEHRESCRSSSLEIWVAKKFYLCEKCLLFLMTTSISLTVSNSLPYGLSRLCLCHLSESNIGRETRDT
jgi:hypothetical protein